MKKKQKHLHTQTRILRGMQRNQFCGYFLNIAFERITNEQLKSTRKTRASQFTFLIVSEHVPNTSLLDATISQSFAQCSSCACIAHTYSVKSNLKLDDKPSTRVDIRSMLRSPKQQQQQQQQQDEVGKEQKHIMQCCSPIQSHLRG